MRTKFRSGLVLLSLCLVAACSANSYNRTETGGTERTGVRLDDTRAVLVTLPKDAGSVGKAVKASGAEVARVIDASFSRQARLVDVLPTPYQSFDDLKDAIAQNNYGYIVVPTLIQWGPAEKGPFKSAPQVQVKLIVLDAATGQELSDDFLDAHGPSPNSLSSLFSAPLSPPELLAKVTDDYVDHLYGILISF